MKGVKNKIVIAVAIVAAVLGGLIYSASQASAKAVVTVGELLDKAQPRARIRLGARVASTEITVKSSPQREVRFLVRDIPGKDEKVPDSGAPTISVVYHGSMPDTLQHGRDVILEGDYGGGEFVAKSLMTQCPSKYEPPVPGAEPANSKNTNQPVSGDKPVSGGNSNLQEQ